MKFLDISYLTLGNDSIIDIVNATVARKVKIIFNVNNIIKDICLKRLKTFNKKISYGWQKIVCQTLQVVTFFKNFHFLSFVWYLWHLQHELIP
jgi:hypothetical protein